MTQPAPTGWATSGPDSRAAARFLPWSRFDELIDALWADGRTVVAPVVEDGALKIAELARTSELPFGWVASTAPGIARLDRRPEGSPAAGRAFDNGTAWSGIKPWTFPAKVESLSVESGADGRLAVRVERPPSQPLAVVGARACDLAALAIHDRVLAGGPAIDPDYASRREDLLVVAVECALATSTCFCASMGTGPEVTSGADVVLSELDGGFVARADTTAGRHLLERLELPSAETEAVERATRQVAATRASMGIAVETEGLPERLLANLESPRWDEIAERCLACANCTLVCPTCFCTGMTVTSDLAGRASSAARTWDSCFTAGFAQVAGGGSFRPRHRDRYRQWLTHKFGTWWEQFGSSGCVGCGRCIAWCPVGIDVREELAAIAGKPLTTAEPSVPADDAAFAATAPVLVPGTRVLAIAPAAVEPASLRVEYVPATVVDVHPETADTSTLRLRTDDPALLAARPGQFVMVAAPAFAIPPISISRIRPDGLELTIRAAGAATSFLARLRPGAELALRGPLGRPWPIEDAEGRDVAIVAGGIGLAPLRGLLDEVLAAPDRFASVRLYLGARTPRDRLFVAEIDALIARGLDVRATVDRAGPEWLGRVGIITELFRGAKATGANVTAFVCGPERMMSAVVDVLADLDVPPEHTWLTLERRMECGVGLCGHCQLGTRFVCRDGPVFSVAELGDDLRREGL
ncbi:MAG TPA: 4Fe-4S dicluster domain-containing protein [Candidatus Limnocylindrales bacterium]|nr:4Fe-4S dicluster domain-containing protein [Candidatus Limnocylindrales bacterium]